MTPECKRAVHFRLLQIAN